MVSLDKRGTTIFFWSFVFCSVFFSGSLYACNDLCKKKPNIVFILADDLGLYDLDLHNRKHPLHETPNIKALSQAGIRFTRGYVPGPNCAPSRASLFSGAYVTRHKVYAPKLGSKGDKKQMPLDAGIIKYDGIGSAQFGATATLRADFLTFAEVLKKADYDTIALGKWHVGNASLHGFDVKSNVKTGYSDSRSAKAITERAITYLDEYQTGDKPFFLYLSHFEVHTPLAARPHIRTKYEEKIAALKESNSSSGKWGIKYDPRYAAMVESLDNAVGDIIKALKRTQLLDNTIIIFASDNGSRSMSNRPFRGDKGSLYEGGVRTPIFVSWKNEIEHKTKIKIPVNLIDLKATFADIAGIQLKADEKGDGVSWMPILEGKKHLMPPRDMFWYYPYYLKPNSKTVAIPKDDRLVNKLGWRSVPGSSIVRGNWKLIEYFEPDRPLELYNLATDVAEKHNLIDVDAYNEIANQLYGRLKSIQAETGAEIPSECSEKFEDTKGCKKVYNNAKKRKNVPPGFHRQTVASVVGDMRHQGR